MNFEELTSRYSEINRKILQEASATSKSVTLIAASKKQSCDAIEAIYRLGHRDFGENYVKELVFKANEMKKRGCHEIRWHMIGHLQSNKIKLLLPDLYCLHTVDSEKLALELSNRCKQQGRKQSLPLFIEVNLDEEKSKSGVFPDQVASLAKRMSQYRELQLQGLMCIPAQGQNPKDKFIRLRELELQCRPFSLGRLSMGMSEDYLIAIQQGATHVRVGTALFGDRRNDIDLAY